jgi:hypothetical protein
VASMDRRELVLNIGAVTRLANLFRLPIVLSTVNVRSEKCLRSGRDARHVASLIPVRPRRMLPGNSTPVNSVLLLKFAGLRGVVSR